MPISFQYRVYKGAYLVIGLFIVLLCYSSCAESKKTTIPEEVPFNTLMQQQFQNDISFAILHLDSIRRDQKSIEKHFKESRKFFKKIEPILASLDVENYGFLNQPNILKIAEEDFTDIKIKKPSGYQVLEEEIFAEEIDHEVITKHVNLVINRLELIKKNASFSHIKTYHFLWMFRKSFVSVALTGITGFDSPVLENSLEDAKVVYKSLKKYVSIFENEFKDKQLLDKWYAEIDQTINDLSGNFNSFDRYHFIKNHTHPQLVLWNQTVTDWKVSFPFELGIKNDAVSLFSAQTFNIDYFCDFNLGATTAEKIALGKRLFYDTNLSTDKNISCSTCHLPNKAFTDGKKIAPGVTRNSPTLLYAALQKGFFYDKRAGSLEGQIVSVVKNKNEFHTDLKTLEEAVKLDDDYIKYFSEAYPDQEIKDLQIRNAIASYIRSLVPFNSKFDRNINALENTLSQSEINGFNLFNGKAKCATCHFAPVFNGTIPPDFKESEMELIGVPQKNDTINAKISKDLGRYHVYNTPERKHFFKTSTVRNVSKTAPYMHNGVYTSLNEVMDFYNRGGGAGIGIEQENQTLPPDPLELTQIEIQELIAFMNSLEDTTAEYDQ